MSKPTKLTPEIQSQVNKWAKWLETMHGVRFHPTTDILFKAKVVTEYQGACPCKRLERPHCPCPEVTDELKKDGLCFCHVFVNKEWAINHGYDN